MTFPRIPASDAFHTAMRNKVAGQPKMSSGDPRVGEFASPAFKPSFTLEHGESIFTLGSCFARGVEQSLQWRKFKVPMAELTLPPEEIDQRWPNPRNVLNKYTPYSMLNEVVGAFTDYDIASTMIEVKDGLYLDLQLHSTVPVPLERAIERRQEINRLTRSAIQQSRIVVVTMGLIEAWFDHESGMFTNQTPSLAMVKKFPDRFSFEVLPPDVVVDVTRDLMARLKEYGHPEQKALLTVSPVPLGRTFTDQDVMIANMYSKSVLRVAAEVVVRENDHIDYFPSYETVMLSDRAASWMDDGIHVKQEMVHHNTARMLDAYLLKDAAE